MSITECSDGISTNTDSTNGYQGPASSSPILNPAQSTLSPGQAHVIITNLVNINGIVDSRLQSLKLRLHSSTADGCVIDDRSQYQSGVGPERVNYRFGRVANILLVLLGQGAVTWETNSCDEGHNVVVKAGNDILGEGNNVCGAGDFALQVGDLLGHFIKSRDNLLSAADLGGGNWAGDSGDGKEGRDDRKLELHFDGGMEARMSSIKKARLERDV
ncbi:uncharacterized protein N7483_004880 [Penicillium malachiteum]|uniref:uncharacterized protein n=1 Tax=Penicillium malachiteum TaxID=1324776 RepID=UPI002546981F|nr:uncharacterized protein N7483_004880 [Penicillium malachiteum]KAJ5730372.1 hypothetical protein N7483_004880 [Penicillium malachiteum]